MRSIIQSLSGKEFTLPDMDSTQRELVKQIRGRRFLLVLDDVWNEDYELWDRLRILLNNGAKGSKVVVTTRSRRVASVMNADDVHCLAGLSDDDCWLLFERRAFESGSSARNPSLVAIGKEIVRRCGGMPLAAKALGSSMRFKREVSQWVAVRDNEIWGPSADVVDDQILPALMLSYSHLPPRLKQCFAYCAMIPKGETMRIETLAQLWVAEGLADLEDVGSQYVDQLLSRSLLEIGQGEEHGAVGLVKMHDVVHDLARLVAGDECSIIGVCGSTATSPDSRYASVLIDGRTPSVAETLSHMRKLRALYVIKTAGDQDEGERVLRAIFSTMKPLRALYLHGFAMKALPAAVQKLNHLRYLDLSGTDLRKLPPAIGRLHNLQILKLRNCSRLEALPESIGELVNLVTLDLCFFVRLSSLPDSIGRLQNLQILKLTFCIELEALPESIGELVNLVTLDLCTCPRLSSLPDSIGRMGNLQIRKLRHCMELEALPESVGELVNLVTLDLYFCRRLSYLPDSIGRMGNLQILNLRRCPGLEALPESIGELVNLVTLDLCTCPRLSSLPDSIGRMGNLRNLDVSKTCITTLPESLSSLSNLQLLKLRDCHRLNEFPKKVQSMRSLTHLDIRGCYGLTRMPAGLRQLRQLRMLPRYLLGDGDGDGDGGLEELGTLNLEGELYIGNLQNLRRAAEACGSRRGQSEGEAGPAFVDPKLGSCLFVPIKGIIWRLICEGINS
ncbi:resistance protein [Musa troglodytarum]|uniref:Resistance protein n=2 Tax=Musa troglodytarum TaxID=320322 RepID=A0A9E7EUP3_9LILI|nr:resistance protein [Musa troglodytarum]